LDFWEGDLLEDSMGIELDPFCQFLYTSLRFPTSKYKLAFINGPPAQKNKINPQILTNANSQE